MDGNYDMDDLSAARRFALMNGLIAYGMSLMAGRLLQRLACQSGFADDLEKVGAEIVRQMKNGIPSGWTIEEEADAIGQAVREFEKNIAQWAAESGGRAKTNRSRL
jgi:hypothetical protein